MNTLWREIRYSLRTLARNPLFSLICILTLALGISANTTVFSIINFLFLRPLPVKAPDQITVLAFQQKAGPLSDTFSIAELKELRAPMSAVFSELIGEQLGLDGLKVSGRAERIVTSYVTGNFFPGFGLQPVAGQLIRRDQGTIPGANPVLVLSYRYWQSHFGGDLGVVGHKAWVDGHPFTIVGIAPKSFHGVHSFINTQAYLPLAMAGIEGYPSDFMENRAIRNAYLYGRLRPGVTLENARAALAVAARRISQQHPATEKNLTLELFPERLARPEPNPDNTTLIIASLFLALCTLVLLIACVNVTNILLVRASVRQREMAIRVALGASRQKLMRQVLSESLLLALGGGIAGVLLGYCGSASLGSLHLGTDFPVFFDFGFDWRVFGYAFAGAIFAGILVGLVPAFGAAKTDLNQTLQTGGRGSVGGRSRLRSLLVTAQVGGSLMLLIVAGLFVRSLAAVQRIQLGFEPTHVVNFSMDPAEIGYSEQQGRNFFREALRRIEASPGIESASFAGVVPLGYYNNSDEVLVPGRLNAAGPTGNVTMYNVVTPGYFRTMGIRVLSGTAFTDADDEKAPYTAVISDAMAKYFWPAQDAIGREFRLAADPSHNLRIIGVVSNIRFEHPFGSTKPFFYLPLWQHYQTNSLQTLSNTHVSQRLNSIPEIERIITHRRPICPFST